MDSRELREQCLALPGSVEEFPFNDEVSVCKVRGKRCGLSMLDGGALQVSVKCGPDVAVRLRASHPASTPGYHLNKRHWNTITAMVRSPTRWCAISWATLTAWWWRRCRR